MLLSLVVACSESGGSDAGEDVAASDATDIQSIGDSDPDEAGNGCTLACMPPLLICGFREDGGMSCEYAPDGNACPGGWQYCGGRCLPLNAHDHCFTCAAQCAADEYCGNGSCQRLSSLDGGAPG